MIKITKSEEHFRSKNDWLDTTHHFSFAEYFDPNRMNFGPLRVFNDDIIQPGTGFDFHQHRDMEIVTYVIDGQLEHRDNQGNHGIINPGEIQVMTAGSGIMHSEFNNSKEKPLRLLQMWIFANKRGLQPSWQQRIFTKQERTNKLLLAVNPENSSNNSTLHIHQDARFYISSLDTKQETSYKSQPARKSYVFVIDGKIIITGNIMNARDTASIENENHVKIVSEKPSEIILIDLPDKYSINQ